MTPNQYEKATKALEEIQHLHPSLLVLSKLTRLLKELNVDQQDLIDLIKTDASLTSDVIRISNTAFYGAKSKCSDISSALMIIGQNRVLKAVNLCVSRNVFNKDLEHYGITADDYWSNSLAAGFIMESLAEATGQEADTAYTLGILHTVGMTIINRILNDLFIDMYWDSSIPQIEWEEHLTGYNYADAGADVLDRWNFPHAFTEVIRHQVNPGRSNQPMLLLDCLHFVLQILNLAGWQLQAYNLMELDEASRHFLEANQIGEEQLGGILMQARDQMTRAMRMFAR